MTPATPLYLSAPAVLCAAGDAAALYNAVTGGDDDSRGIVPVTFADGARFLAARISDSDFTPESAAKPGAKRRVFRIADAVVAQLRPVVDAAGNADRIALCVGSCDNGSEASRDAHETYANTGAFPADYRLAEQGAGFLTAYLADAFGVTGPALTVSTACASSAGAVVKGAELIRAGFADAAIVGGIDLAGETVLRGFGSLEALSVTRCTPFSKNRDGTTLGEAAAFFVLSRADISGNGISLFGSGESADAHHITAPRADGAGAIAAMRAALADAGLAPEAIDYVNLHGTGTALNDAMEAAAVAAVFPHFECLPVSSTKRVTGHTLGAAGALELAVCYLTLATVSDVVTDALLPAHGWDGVRDDTLPALNLVAAGTRAPVRVCMSNSFAFGGCNTSIVLGRKQHAGD